MFNNKNEHGACSKVFNAQLHTKNMCLCSVNETVA